MDGRAGWLRNWLATAPKPVFIGYAIAAAFVLLAFRWCVDLPRRRAWHLAAMAALAGLCLLTRVSTSVAYREDPWRDRRLVRRVA